MLDAPPFEHVAHILAGLDGHRAHQHRLTRRVLLCNVFQHGLELGCLVAIDQVVHVVAHNRAVGGDLDHVQVVDLLKLFLFRLGRAGHARQLAVHAEEVLEGDGGQGHGLLLHLDPLFGLDGLVQTFRVAPAFHEATGELVHDDHLVGADDVVLVAPVEGMGAQGVVQVGHHVEVLGRVEVVDVQRLLHVLDALLGQRRHHLLLLHQVVRFGREPAHQGRKGDIVVGALLGLARDDERRARLVHEDVVHLVHDGKVQLPLGRAAQVMGHVVAQIVETKLVVGAIGDVGLVRFPTADGAQILVAVVCIRIVRVEEKAASIRVAGAVLDHSRGEAQQVVDGSHELQAEFG